MYEVSEIQDYKQKWLEAERELALMGVEIQPTHNYEPIDNADKEVEPINKPPSASRKLED